MPIMNSKKIILSGMIVLLVVMLISESAFAREIENLLSNGNFEKGVPAPWAIGGKLRDNGGVGATMTVVDKLKDAKVPEDPIEGKLCLLVDVDKAAAAAGDVQFMTANDPPVYKKGEKYTFSAYIKSNEKMRFHLLLSGGSEDGFQPSFQSEIFTMTEKWEEYHLTTASMPLQPKATRAKFFVGYGPGAFWVDNIKIYIGDYEPTFPTKPKAVEMTVGKLATSWASIKAKTLF
ncbi:MAG: carbohydrate binding domain-containing protein [Candidatus Poribacteria bacterium]